MSLSLLGPAAPSFDEPLEMLDACHGRIKAQLATLRRLVAHLPRHGADKAAQEAARGVVRYFSVAAPHHHEDEEIDLLPALLATAAGADRLEAEALVARILADHQRMDPLRDAALAVLEKIAAGEGVELPAAQVETLATLYLGHIEMETRELFPLAKRLLSPAQTEELGRKMAARRGVSFAGA